MKTYSELTQLGTYVERLNYLKLKGVVGEDTFGFDRYLNQVFYRTPEWKRIRDYIIARDCGCDMGLTGYDIVGRILVHHMNPITSSDILSHSEEILDPEYLICVSHQTHNAIHYGKEEFEEVYVERKPNDTCPWKL